MIKRIIPCLFIITSVFAGPPADKSPTPLQPPTESNPLSFYNGMLTFDFQERMRFEDRNNNFDFNSGVKSPTDGDWLLNRARLGVQLKPSDWFNLYVQGQSSYEFGSTRAKIPGVMGAEGNDPINLRQAYIQLGPKDFNLTIGRQILAYGDERLVGAFDWNNFGRVWDAAKVHYAKDTWSIDVFAASVVVPTNTGFDHSDLFDGNETGRGQIFSGIYFSTTEWIPVQTTDLYAFELHQKDKGGDTDFVTLGTRMKADPHKLNGYLYETEMAAQVGQVGGKDLSAFAGHWAAGYEWLHTEWDPTFKLEYNFATGDSNAKDGKVGTFQNLFPTNHLFYGNMDLFSWQNMHETAVSFMVHPAETLTAKLSFQADWLADTTDAWYRANGVTQVRPINPKASPFLGTELDATVTWKPCKHLSLQAAYNHFFPGDYLKATGANSAADFTYVMLTVNF